MNFKTTSLSIFIALSSVACATFQSPYAGEIGCPSEEIQVLDSKRGFLGAGPTTEKVSCRGQTFICTRIYSDETKSESVKCKRELSRTSNRR